MSSRFSLLNQNSHWKWRFAHLLCPLLCVFLNFQSCKTHVENLIWSVLIRRYIYQQIWEEVVTSALTLRGSDLLSSVIAGVWVELSGPVCWTQKFKSRVKLIHVVNEWVRTPGLMVSNLLSTVSFVKGLWKRKKHNKNIHWPTITGSNRK